MTPKQVKVMAAYFEATERLADATDALIATTKALIDATGADRDGLLDNCTRFEEVAKIRLVLYRRARAEYEAM